MKRSFGTLPDGRQAWLYTIRGGGVQAEFTEYGATLVRLYVPDREGRCADVVLGYRDVQAYASDWMNIGATVGRCANRIKGGSFELNGRTVSLAQNNMGNNLHSGPDFYSHRFWQVEDHQADRITFLLESPDGDQGFPGNARIRVQFLLEEPGTLRICYEAICDQDTVFNLTNHSCFNLAGHQHPHKALEQVLTLFCSRFIACDEATIPTGEIRGVEGSPMDFRESKPIGQDIGADYDALVLQTGYDHCYVVEQPLCARLWDRESGRCLQVFSDSPGIQLYSGNYINIHGKDGVHYPDRSGIALETQYFPDAVHHPQWPQPIVKAGEYWRSTTCFVFTAE